MKKTYLDHYPKILTIASAVALVASFWQSVERFNLLKNPNTPLSCDINPVIDCGSVLGHRLAALFGFPNAFIGMVMFAMLFMAGLGLWTGSKLSSGFRNIVMILSTIAVAFSVWFFYVSLYIIGKACIFCLVIWPASVLLFWYGLLYWLNNREKSSKWQTKILRLGAKNHLAVLVLIYAIMILLFLFRFRTYYFG